MATELVSENTSPAETKQLEKKLHFEVSDLKQFYLDIFGLSELSFADIKELNSKGSHIHPDLKKYYYYTREELLENYYKRFS